MGLKWVDVNEIAYELVDSQPDVDPLSVKFTDLRDWVLALPDFDDDPDKCGERILEAIQMAWLREKD